MKLLICDDEESILEGLKQILDWEDLGFTEVIGVNSSLTALDYIKDNIPDIVLIDINMPNLTGLEVIEKSKEIGFNGEFIILSGFSKFSYAQKAIKYNVFQYLCKPIEEDELQQSIIKLIKKIEERKKDEKIFNKYENEMMKNFISYYLDDSTIENNLFLENEKYQVIAYDNFYKDKTQDVKNLNEILNLSECGKYIHMKKNGINFIILVGADSILYLDKVRNKYLSSSQKNSMLDKLFIYYGKVVNKFSHIKNSYDDIFMLMEYRFFSASDQHFFSYEYLEYFLKPSKNTINTKKFIDKLTECIQKLYLNNLEKICLDILEEIKRSHLSQTEALDCLTEIYFNTLQNINRFFSDMDIMEESYNITMEVMKSKAFLYEVLDYMKEKFILIINTLKVKNTNVSIYEIIAYIEENCQENLKLKAIAEKFNYNSSYLGKLFARTTGCSFNTYLETVRVNKSKILLADKNLKIYEVAEKVGYNNVDYFHRKFKNIVNKSPLEYRKSIDK